MDKLLQVLLTANLDKKPTVDELATLAGIEKVTGAERDEAWDKFTEAKKAQADKDAANAPKTAPTKDDKPAYKVTVKRDGFRRLGRAWVGTTELKKSELSAADLKTLNADPMFVVVEL